MLLAATTVWSGLLWEHVLWRVWRIPTRDAALSDPSLALQVPNSLSSSPWAAAGGTWHDFQGLVSTSGTGFFFFCLGNTGAAKGDDGKEISPKNSLPWALVRLSQANLELAMVQCLLGTINLSLVMMVSVRLLLSVTQPTTTHDLSHV